jgi:hypothetical protein
MPDAVIHHNTLPLNYRKTNEKYLVGENKYID